MMQSDSMQMVISAVVAVGAGMATYKYATNSKLVSAGIGVAAYVVARMAVRNIANMPQMGPGRQTPATGNTPAR
jgi:hypothetical protein